MAGGIARDGMIDRLAIGLSGLCLVHCIASATLIGVIAAGGSFLLDPIVHEVGMMIALLLGLVGLGRGIVTHGHPLPAMVGGVGLVVLAGALYLGHEAGGTFLSIVGVTIVALGHALNRRAARRAVAALAGIRGSA